MQYTSVAGIALSSFLALSGPLLGSSTVAQTGTKAVNTAPSSHMIRIGESTNAASSTQESEKKAVLNPVLLKVSWCESRGRQFNPDGSILRGEVNPHDVGIMQINTDYHLEESDKLGYNIYTTDGNIRYANYLYETQGFAPWSASRYCWEEK